MKSRHLEDHLCKYDGKSVSILSEARVACDRSPAYFEELVALCFDPRPLISAGATWILRAELEGGVVLSPASTSQLVKSLGRLQDWQAQLHICQGAGHLRLTLAQAECFVKWAKTLCDHPRPFLRAWSVSAIVHYGRRYDGVRGDAELVLKTAHEDPAASVRARARKLEKDWN